VAASVVVPLTLIRQAYSFSVGYGLSVAAMSAALLLSFPLAPTLTPSCVLPVLSLAYGLRLAGFLLYRQWTVPSKAEQLKTFDKTPKLKRVPLAAAVAGFYALMVSPVLSSLNPVGPVLSETVQWSGVAIAALGLVIESVADHHKLTVKAQYSRSDTATQFVGPTGGLYRLCRHPNYLGEVLFWAGLYLGGLPSFGRNLGAWSAGTLGLYGIVGIMTKATERLDGTQKEKYQGQTAYQLWREKTADALFPGFGGFKSFFLG